VCAGGGERVYDTGMVLADLGAAIDGLDLPVDGDVLADVVRLRDRLDAKVTMSAAEFDAVQLWDVEGAASMACWLRARAGMSNRDARRMAATARRMHGAPVTAQAWVEGRLTGAQVQAICANVSDRTARLYADHEAALVPCLLDLDLADTAAVMRQWAARAEAEVGEDVPAEETGKAHLSPTLDGKGRLDADLDAEGYQLAKAAIRLGLGRRDDDDTRTPAQRRHDALVAIFRHFLDHQRRAAGGHHRPHVNITVELAALLAATGQGRHHDGAAISTEDARRLACDANVHRVITRGRSSVLDYGHSTRVVAVALFMVLAGRDGGCRFPGCDRPVDWCDAHHIRHWINGGPTVHWNLVLLCSRHHQVVHRRGWEIKLLPHGTVEVTDPQGRTRSSDPPHWARAA